MYNVWFGSLYCPSGARSDIVKCMLCGEGSGGGGDGDSDSCGGGVGGGGDKQEKSHHSHY